MKQLVYYSPLIMAVAPVAAMADTGHYQTTEAQAVAVGTDLNLTVLTTTQIDKIEDYKLVIKAGNAVTNFEYDIIYNGTTSHASKSLTAGENEIDLTPAHGTDPGTLQFVVTSSSEAVSLTVSLEPDNEDVIKNKLAKYIKKVDAYISEIGAAGYTVSTENNKMLLLLHDIAVPGSEQYKVANFELFELYKDTEEIEKQFTATVKAIEADELAKTAVTDDELKTLPTEPVDVATAIADAKAEFEAATTPEAVKVAKAKLEAAQQYAQFILTADKIQAAIKDYEALLDSYDKSIGTKLVFNEDGTYVEGGALLGTYQIKAFRTSKTRLQGIKDTKAKFLELAAEAFQADNTKFVAPTNVKVGTDYTLYTDINALLGTEAEPALSQKNEIGVLNNIAYVKYCAQQYQARYLEVLTTIAAATKAYNELIPGLEATFSKWEAEAPTYTPDIDYVGKGKALEQVKTILNQLLIEDSNDDTILKIEKLLNEARKTGGDISYDKDTKWTKTPADKWIDALKAISIDPSSTLSKKIDYFTNATTGVEAARKKFDAQMDLITGTDTDEKLQYWIDKIGWDGLTDKVKTLYQEEYTTIGIEIQTLKDKLYKANENLGTDDKKSDFQNFQILNDPWLTNWDNPDFDMKDNGNYSSYKNLMKRLVKLYDKVKNAKFEQEALWGLQANGQELSDRLRNASDVIENLTKDYTDPEYLSKTFYGYTGNPATNTGFAKTITDYVAKLNDAATKKYGDGDTEAAQMLKNGAKTVDMARPAVNDFENKGGSIGMNDNNDAGEQWAVGYLQLNGTARTKAPGLKLEPGQQASFRFKVENLDGNYWVKASIYNGDTKLAEKWVNRSGTYTVSFTATANYNDLRMDFEGNDARIGDGDVYKDNFDSKVFWGPLVVAGAEDVFKDNKDIDGDSQTDDTWNAIETMVKKLEADASGDKTKDGVAKKAIDHYVEVRTAIETAQEQIQAVLNEVKDHGVYTDKTSTRKHHGEYATLIEDWNTEVETALNDVKKVSTLNSTYNKLADDHWDDLLNNLTPMSDLKDLATYYDKATKTVKDKIATDKAEYDEDVFEEDVTRLYHDLYGTDGLAAANKDGKLDEVKDAFDAAQAAYDTKKGTNPDDVFGSAAHGADKGNATTLQQAWYTDMPAYLTAVEKEVKDAWDKNPSPGNRTEWEEVNDLLQAASHKIEALLNTDKEIKNTYEVEINEKTCIQSLTDLTNDLAANKAAYDAILDIKGRLEKKAENVKKALTDEYEETNESKNLLDIVENYFKPMPTAESKNIEKLYKDMKAVSGYPENPLPDEESEYEAYANGDVKYMTKRNKNQVVYWKFSQALWDLSDLYETFYTGYPTYLANKNANIFNNDVKGEYDKAMTKYKEIVFNLKEFKIPNDEYLKEVYDVEFKKATDNIYQAPELLLKAKALAEANMHAANDAKPMETYDPTGKNYVKFEDEAIYNVYCGLSSTHYDQERIHIIQTACENYFAQFTEAMKNAVKDRWAQLKTPTNDAITVAWNDVIKDYYATPKSPAPRVTFEDYYLTDGTKFVDKDTQYDYLWESKGKFKEADDSHNKITASGWKTYEEFGRFDDLISGEILDVDKNNVLTGINKHLNKKKNEAANTDLTNRIEIARIEKVNPDTKALKGDPEEKDGEGNAIDLKKKYKKQYAGFGPTADADGYYYSYERALGKTAYDLLCKEFDKLVEETVDAAEELKNSYNEAVQLPIYYDKELATDVDSRQKVIELYRAYTTHPEKFKAILNKFLDGFNYTDPKTGVTKHYEGYNDFIADTDYNAAMDNFETRFATEKAGIESLYAGTDPAITNTLKVMEDQFNQEQKEKGSVDIFKLTDLLDDLIASDKGVKKMDYDAMIKELTTLKAEYNQMVAKYNKAIDDETDATEKEKLKDERDALIAKFDTAGDALNIDENIAKLEDYEARRKAYSDYDINKNNYNYLSTQESSMKNDAPYGDYVTVEHNVGLIKTAIAMIDGTQTDETIDQMGKNLLGALQTLQAKKSAYINQDNNFSVDQLLTAPVNPKDEADTYKFDDFGLYQFYRPAEFKGVEFKGSYLKDAIGKVAESVQKHIDAKDILLFAANLQKQINEFNAGGNVDIDDIDLKTNSNIDDAVTSAYELNLQEVKFAEEQKAQLERLQAEYDAVAAKVQPAKDAIAGLGDFQGDFSKVNEELAKIQRRITVYYLANKQILETVTMTKDKGAAIYKIKKFVLNSAEVTDEWIASKGLTDVYNKVTGEVSLPGNIGLTAIEALIADEVQKFVTQVANAKYAEAHEAYEAALAKLNATQMRFMDKAALRGKLYGANIADANDGGFQEQLQGTGGLEARKATQTIKTIDKYVADVDAFVKALLGTDDEAGFVDEVAGKTAGDLDGNGIINVIDLTDLLNYVVNPKLLKNPAFTPEMFAARDLNNDGYIDVVDLGIMVDIITGQTQLLKDQGVFAARAQHNSNETLRADVAATNGNTQRIAISLNNERDYTTFQMDITLPEGMRLVGQSLSDRANGQQLYANEWDGKTRLVGFTMSKAAFTGNDGDVLYLDVETDESYKGGSIRFEDIIFVTTESEGVRFSMKGEATSIADRIADTAKDTIYNLGGRMMNSLKKGVNILRGNNGAKKVIKK